MPVKNQHPLEKIVNRLGFDGGAGIEDPLAIDDHIFAFESARGKLSLRDLRIADLFDILHAFAIGSREVTADIARRRPIGNVGIVSAIELIGIRGIFRGFARIIVTEIK